MMYISLPESHPLNQSWCLVHLSTSSKAGLRFTRRQGWTRCSPIAMKRTTPHVLNSTISVFVLSAASVQAIRVEETPSILCPDLVPCGGRHPCPPHATTASRAAWRFAASQVLPECHEVVQRAARDVPGKRLVRELQIRHRERPMPLGVHLLEIAVPRHNPAGANVHVVRATTPPQSQAWRRFAVCNTACSA
jgi:hypothetical protein